MILRLLPALALFALMLAPVAVMTIRGEIISRTMGVAIFAPDWLDKNRGEIGRVPFFFITLFDNLFLHLRPSFLFFTGDGNPRHSAQLVGQLSPVDVFALLLAMAGTLRLLALGFQQVKGEPTVAWPRVGGAAQRLVLVSGFSLAAWFLATVPAALTWESLPHSLRSIGAWPFVVLFTGAVLALGWSRYRWVPAATALIAVLYSAWYLPGYFKFYRHVDANVFHRDITEALASGDAATPPQTARESLKPIVPRYGDEVLRYFLMRHDHLSCQGAVEALQQLRK